MNVDVMLAGVLWAAGGSREGLAPKIAVLALSAALWPLEESFRCGGQGTSRSLIASS